MDVSPGSLGELRAILGLHDPAVGVVITGTRPAPAEPIPAPAGRMGVAAPPRGIVLGLAIAWSRPELASRAAPLWRFADRVLNWWMPLGVSRLAWRMGFGRGVLAVGARPRPVDPSREWGDRDMDALMVEFALTFLVDRRPAVAPRTIVAMEPTDGRASAFGPGEVALAYRGLGACLANPERFAVDWEPIGGPISRHGKTVLTARCLRDGASRVEWVVVPDPAGPPPGLWGIDGHRAEATARGSPHGASMGLDLGRPMARGEQVALWAGREGVKVALNPVLFELSDPGPGRRYTPRFERPPAEIDAADVGLIAGGSGLRVACRPLPLSTCVAEESDASVLARARDALAGRLARRGDVAHAARVAFPELLGARCREASRLGGTPPRAGRGPVLEVALAPADVDRAPEIVGALRARLVDRLWVSNELAVEVRVGDLDGETYRHA